MSAATPTPQDAGLPAPPASAPAPSPLSQSITLPPAGTPSKPTILHLGDDIRWNHELYAELGRKFQIERSYSMGREEFKKALKERRWGDFVGMYRPFWNTGGEMGNWDEELITDKLLYLRRRGEIVRILTSDGSSLLPKSCKVYASAGAGFDWVDTKTMAEYGIVYCNSASACTESVVDVAIVLILSTYRAITWSFLAARSCSPSQFHGANQNIAAVTHNPNGSILGIVGLGKIGYRLAQKAGSAFQMKIWYHDVVRMDGREKEVGARWCETLEELLKNADCVVLAAPFSGSVLLSHKEFAMFKRGSRLVNIARGKLVDEEALVKALDEGIISSAGLDVHANEPHVNAELAKRNNIMVLSHTAGASVESHVGFERLGMENLLSYLGGGEAITPVNLRWLKKERQ